MKKNKTINMIKMEKMPGYWKDIKENHWYSIEKDQLSILELKESYINDKNPYLYDIFKNQKWEAYSYDKFFDDVIQAPTFKELENKLFHVVNIKIKGIKEKIIEDNDLTII